MLWILCFHGLLTCLTCILGWGALQEHFQEWQKPGPLSRGQPCLLLRPHTVRSQFQEKSHPGCVPCPLGGATLVQHGTWVLDCFHSITLRALARLRTAWGTAPALGATAGLGTGAPWMELSLHNPGWRERWGRQQRPHEHP